MTKAFSKIKRFLAIDAMEDSIAPLDDNTVHIRGLIPRFSSCYHESDKEAEMIIQAIGSGQRPLESKERPPRRKGYSRVFRNKTNFTVKEEDYGRERSKASEFGINEGCARGIS